MIKFLVKGVHIKYSNTGNKIFQWNVIYIHTNFSRFETQQYTSVKKQYLKKQNVKSQIR